MSPQLKAEVIAWLNTYGPIGCVALVAAAVIASLRPDKR